MYSFNWTKVLDVDTGFKFQQQNSLFRLSTLEYGQLYLVFRYSCFTQVLLVGWNTYFNAEEKLSLSFSPC
jgi:hypothetical protein